METRQAVVALVHVEAARPGRARQAGHQGIKQIKWLAGKFATTNVVLHSFAHLATSRAEPAAADALLADMRDRLAAAGYRGAYRPFGYFNEFRLHVAGPSLAKVFVEF